MDLKVIYDIIKNQNKIKNSIKKFGYFAEHNYHHYLYSENDWNKNIFFDFGNNRILLAQFEQKNNIWSLFPNGILGPKSERLDLLFEVLNYILKKKEAKKFVIEVSEDIRREILKKFKNSGKFRMTGNAYILYWPIYNMEAWNLSLKGSKWKKLRNVKNSFYKKNKVKTVDCKYVPKEDINKILFNWLKKRNDNDRVEKEYFSNLINNNFEGFDMAKTLYINNKPSTITAGWKIPNSNDYYSSIGIVDYSCPGLGEIANIEDLNILKRMGFDYVDFGGSDKILLNFKKKFKPEKIYKTYTFSIIKI